MKWTSLLFLLGIFGLSVPSSPALGQFSANVVGKWSYDAQIGSPYNLDVDVNGFVYILGSSHAGSSTLLWKYDPTGVPIGQIFNLPGGGYYFLAVQQDTAYVSGVFAVVALFPTNQFNLTTAPVTIGLPFGVSGIEAGSNGDFYVSANYRIWKFSRSGTELLHWGAQGNGNGFFSETPRFFAFGNQLGFFVLDKPTNRIGKFTADGFYTGVYQYASLNTGAGIAVDPTNGFIYVSSDSEHRILVFSQAGPFLGVIGPQPGSNDGWFDTPHVLAVGPTGLPYVLDSGRSAYS
jgi:hypothetical protein